MHRQQSSGLILVTGCPRSGTKYISCLLAELGLDVQHEAMGRDGTSSWCMAVEADSTPWGPPRKDYHFTVTLHQVRNPVDAIPSFSTLAESSWQFVYAHTPCRPQDSPLARAAKLWYHWNIHAGRVAQWRYRVEQLPAVFEEFCSRVGVRADRQALKRIATNVNTRAFAGFGRVCKWVCNKLAVEPPAYLRNHCADRSVYARSAETAFGWDALRRLDPEAHDKVLDLATRYGYSTSELRLPALSHVSSAAWNASTSPAGHGNAVVA